MGVSLIELVNMGKTKLDWDFFQNSKQYFESYNKQSKLLTSTFTHISNLFPQSKLKTVFENSKGSKISKGYNLDGYPYQVLDLIRNFDEKDGFNIRILAWWGNGLYVFLTYGYAYAEAKIAILKRLQSDYFLAKTDLLFDYPKLINTIELPTERVIEQQIAEKKVIQLWKTLNLSNVGSQTDLELENLLGRLLDIHS